MDPPFQCTLCPCMHKLLIESRCSILFTEVNFHPEECDLARSGATAVVGRQGPGTTSALPSLWRVDSAMLLRLLRKP